MILRRIVEFAERQKSSQPTGYQQRFITKVIALDTDGKLRAVIPLTGDKKAKIDGKFRFEPQESPRRTVAVVGRPFADNVKYVLGKCAENDDPAKVAKMHAAWVSSVRQIALQLGDVPEVRAVVAWLDADGPNTLRTDDRIQDDDELTISVNGSFVTDLAAIRQYWGAKSTGGPVRRCLITGEVGPVVDRMPAPIKGVPDGQMSGTALISVNNAAGESYGLSAALNSPISASAAEKLCNGLNTLINEERGQDEKGRRLYRYSLRIGGGLYIAWCREEQPTNFFTELAEPDPQHVTEFIRSAESGRHGAPPGENDFYVLSLSANSARIIVRDFHETTLTSAKSQLGRWFQRLQLTGLDGNPSQPLGIYRLAACLYRDANKEMPVHVPTMLLSAALKGRPIPEAILGLAVKRNLAMQGPFTLTPSRKKILDIARLALIKAVLTPVANDASLNQMNTEHPNPAYHCGRLLAILESIQRLAIPGLNATLTDRHYGAACASPATVFANLLTDATSAHLPKIRKANPGIYTALSGRLQEVAVAIGYEFPKTQALHEQGLFALGYYHQKAYDGAAARKVKELRALADASTTEEETNEE